MANLKPIEDVVFTIVDFGTFISLGDKLSEKSKVYYYSPIDDEYRDAKGCCIGDGLTRNGHDIERIDEFMTSEIIKVTDCFVFPDIGWGGTQRYLRHDCKKAVWGSMGADDFELYRTEFIKLLEKVGLPIVPWKPIIGLTNLILYLKDKKNKWVKVNKFRENTETWHHIDDVHSQRKYEELAVEFGGVKELIVYVVQDPVEGENVIEIGFDGWTVNGQYPEASYMGYELKNECYDKETEVLTDQGWKFFKDLDRTEKILSLDISDTRHYSIRYEKPTNYINKKYKGKMLQIENSNTDLCVTPKHNLFIQVNEQRPNGKIVTWPDYNGNLNTFRQGTHSRKLVPADTIDLSQWFSMPHPKSGQYYPQKHKRWFNYKSILMSASVYAEFMGWFLSEGYARLRLRGGHVTIYQENYAEECERAIKATGLKYTHARGSFDLYNKDLAEYLVKFGNSYGKYIPQEIKNAGVGTIKNFLHAYCLGDGSFRSCSCKIRGKERKSISRIYFTHSKQMASDLQELLIKVGSIANIRRSGKQYIVRERTFKSKNWVLPKHSKWIDYNDRVYCVTVPSNIIMVRRKGKAIWCGNCYLGVKKLYKDLPEEVKFVNEKMSPMLAEYQYRNFIATEIRIKDGEAYFIDPTMRMAGQTEEQLLETCTNLAEVIWKGANGELIEPEFAYDFAVEATLHYTENSEIWKTITVPKAVEQWLKLYHYCIVDGAYHFPPGKNDEIGVLLGVGNSIEKALDHLKKNMEILKNEPVRAELRGFADLLEEVKKAEKEGVKFTDKKIPKPAEVL